MNLIIIIAILTISFYIWNRYNKKQRNNQHFTLNYKNWGKPKQNTDFDFDKIERYKRNLTPSKKVFHCITTQTNIDLDLDELFQYIDRTTSAIGQQYLYYRLHTIGSKEIDKKTQDYTNLFIDNATLRFKIQEALQPLGNKDGYYFETLFNNQNAPQNKYKNLIIVLNTASVLALSLTYFYPVISLLFLVIFPINMYLHYTNKNNLLEYQLAISQFKQTYSAAKRILNTPELRNINNDLNFIDSLKELETTTSLLNFEKKTDNEFATIIWLPIELLKILFNIEYITFYKFLKKVTKHQISLHQLFIAIGNIDLALTKASILSQTDICIPTFTPDKKTEIEGIYHPLIKDCIKNDLTLLNKSLLLTGSNMSGKTTFIRTITINALLAQTIGIVFAKQYSAPFYKIQTSIRITDNMFTNTSYYLQEVVTIQEFIKSSQNDQHNLYVLDEIFKGTNTIERISASYAILKYLNSTNNTILVSTHDIELIELLKKHDYEIAHFNESIQQETLMFDYKLKYGTPTTTNAIKILQLYNYPSEITEEARELKKTLSK